MRSNSGLAAPFVTFAAWLLLPTIASLAAVWLVLRLYYRRSSPRPYAAAATPAPVALPNPSLTRIVKCSLAILVGLAITNIAASVLTGAIVNPPAADWPCRRPPHYLFSGQRVTVLKAIDWCTLVFFAAMFVLMAAVWETGFFQSLAGVAGVTTVPAILATSVVTSQFISNVPFVALFQPLIMQAGGTTARLMALAAGSTIAGNLTILGAASNVIIIQQAESEGGDAYVYRVCESWGAGDVNTDRDLRGVSGSGVKERMIPDWFKNEPHGTKLNRYYCCTSRYCRQPGQRRKRVKMPGEIRKHELNRHFIRYRNQKKPLFTRTSGKKDYAGTVSQRCLRAIRMVFAFDTGSGISWLSSSSSPSRWNFIAAFIFSKVSSWVRPVTITPEYRAGRRTVAFPGFYDDGI